MGRAIDGPGPAAASWGRSTRSPTGPCPRGVVMTAHQDLYPFGPGTSEYDPQRPWLYTLPGQRLFTTVVPGGWILAPTSLVSILRDHGFTVPAPPATSWATAPTAAAHTVAPSARRSRPLGAGAGRARAGRDGRRGRGPGTGTRRPPWSAPRGHVAEAARTGLLLAFPGHPEATGGCSMQVEKEPARTNESSDWTPRPTLAGTDYTSLEVYEQEREHVWWGDWVCVGRAEDVPNPGTTWSGTSPASRSSSPATSRASCAASTTCAATGGRGSWTARAARRARSSCARTTRGATT